MKHNPLTNDQKKWILTQGKHYYTLSQLAKKFNKPPQTIHVFLKENGAKCVSARELATRKIYRLYKQGRLTSINQAKVQAKISHKLAESIIKEHKLQLGAVPQPNYRRPYHTWNRPLKYKTKPRQKKTTVPQQKIKKTSKKQLRNEKIQQLKEYLIQNRPKW